MDVIQQQPIQVTFDYPVVFTTGLFQPDNPTLRELLGRRRRRAERPRSLFFLDSGVADAQPGLLRRHRPLRRQPPCGRARAGRPAAGHRRRRSVQERPGACCERIQHAIHDARLCRHSYVAAIGGGAVLDVVGYAAATAHRGIRLIRIPTTVLAQDDSAVGVKNGVNAFGKKNYLGTFAPPFAVINDFAFLATLSDRDWRRGSPRRSRSRSSATRPSSRQLEADAAQLAARDAAAMERLVRRSAALHLAHISDGGDPFELGSSRPLDFGHWAAHKLEQLTDHRLRHGEAVAIGIALDTTYAHLQGFLPEPELAPHPRPAESRSASSCSAPELARSSTTPDADGSRARRPRGVPRAPRRQPDDHAAPRHRASRSTCTKSTADAMIRSIELVARAQTLRGPASAARRAS